MTHSPSVAARVLKTDVIKYQSLSDGRRHRARAEPRSNAGLHLEEVKEVLDVQALFVDVPGAEQKPLRHGAAARKGGGKKGERADRDDPIEPTPKNDHVCGIISQHPDQGEQGCSNAF